MIDTEKHNGWTNRATWATNLWLTTDEYLFARGHDAARDARRDPDRFGDLVSRYLRNWEDIVDDCDQFRNVNWAEILTTTFPAD